MNRAVNLLNAVWLHRMPVMLLKHKLCILQKLLLQMLRTSKIMEPFELKHTKLIYSILRHPGNKWKPATRIHSFLPCGLTPCVCFRQRYLLPGRGFQDPQQLPSPRLHLPLGLLPMQESQETQVQFLGWEDSLEKEMAAHASILAWEVL